MKDKIVAYPQTIATRSIPSIHLIFFQENPFFLKTVCNLIGCKQLVGTYPNVLKFFTNKLCIWGFLCQLSHGWWVESNLEHNQPWVTNDNFSSDITVLTPMPMQMFRPEYSWKIARWTLNINQSINHANVV